MARAADESLFGRSIAGKYVVESFIGGGAMGSVYRARQKDIDKLVALKVLHRELLVDPQFAARFKREAKAASRLDHPNSMRVLDYGQEPDGLCYMALELLEGRSLFQILRDESPLSKERIVEMLRQTLAALAVAHDMGVVHRDLKPENIIVLSATDDEGTVHEVVKVCDFGMAKISSSRHETEEKLSEKLTSHGVVVGTPEYMSPEQGRGDTLDGRSDVYSVGVILYQLITGRLPFQAETAVGVLLKHLVEEPVPPSRIDANVDAALEAIAMRAMSKRPADRFAGAREMRTELRSALASPSMPRMVAAGPSSLAAAESRRSIAEAATVQVEAPSTRVAVSVQSPPGRSLRLARDLLSVPPPPPRRSLAPTVIGVLALAAVAVVAWRGKPLRLPWIGTVQLPWVASSTPVVAAPAAPKSAALAPPPGASGLGSPPAPSEENGRAPGGSASAASSAAGGPTSPEAASSAEAKPGIVRPRQGPRAPEPHTPLRPWSVPTAPILPEVPGATPSPEMVSPAGGDAGG